MVGLPVGLKVDNFASGDSEISGIEFGGEPEEAAVVVLILLKLPCLGRRTEVRLSNSCAVGNELLRPIADIGMLGIGDLSWPSPGGNVMLGALDIAENTGLKGSGDWGNSCETMISSSDGIASPDEDVNVILYALMSVELRAIPMGLGALPDILRLRILLSCEGLELASGLSFSVK